MTQSEDRLTRVENILLATGMQFNQISQQQQVNTQAIGQVLQQHQTNTQAIGQILQQQQINTQAISQLNTRIEQGFAESRQQFQESVSYLVSTIGDFVEEMQQDRVIIREMQSEVLEIQSEVREMQSDIREIQLEVRDIRSDIREIQAEIRGLQIENQRMLQYLFGQQEGDNNT